MKTILKTVAILAFAVSAHAQKAKVRSTTTSTSSTTNYSFASNTEHEVVLSPSNISIQSYKYGKSRTDVKVYGAYNHHIKDNIQVGGEGGILPATAKNGDSKSLIAAMGVFTWNFDSNLRAAFFAQGGLGLYPAFDKDDGTFDSKISFFAGAGKRFEAWGKINYMPYFRIWKRGDENSSFEIQALNFSIFY
jgi:hypothetical protein